MVVVESGSIGAAARKLGVSQPGITKSIRGLEAELGVQLLQRSTRGIVPTPYGRAFFARARVAQSELRKAEQEIEQLAGERSGSVAFGVGPIAAALIVPEAVSRFRRQFPSVHLRVIEGFVHALVPLVRDETVDFAIGPRLPGFRVESGMTFKPLFHHVRVVACRTNHPLRNARTLAQLAGATWLSFEPHELLDKTFTSFSLPPPRPIMQFESHNAFLGLLRSTDMLGVAPQRLLAKNFAGEYLREIAIAEPMPPLTVGMFTRSDTPLTPVATAMAKALQAAGRELAFSA